MELGLKRISRIRKESDADARSTCDIGDPLIQAVIALVANEEEAGRKVETDENVPCSMTVLVANRILHRTV